MKSRVFLHSVKGSDLHLYVGDLSTSEGLSIFPPEFPISVVRFGATNYKGDGWVSEENIPQLSNIQDLSSFLYETDLCLVDFEASISKSCSINSHDDSECNFIFTSRSELIEAIKKFAPIESEALINTILENTEAYIECSENGKIQSYASFDEYLAQRT